MKPCAMAAHWGGKTAKHSLPLAIVLCAIVTGVSACGTGSAVETIRPVATAPNFTTTTSTVAPNSRIAARNTPLPTDTAVRNSGVYPNLNIAPQAAAPQLTKNETDARLAELRATRDRLSKSKALKATSVDDMRKLGAAALASQGEPPAPVTQPQQ